METCSTVTDGTGDPTGVAAIATACVNDVVADSTTVVAAVTTSCAVATSGV